MPGNEVYGDMGMQMERPESEAAEPEEVEAAVPDEQTLTPEEIPGLIAKYPEASDLLNLFATGGPGKRILTDEELYFYSEAIKIYTENTLKAIDLLFPIVLNTHVTTKGKRPTLNALGSVESIPDIPFYNNRIERGVNVEGIIQNLVNVIMRPPYGPNPLKDLNEVAEILINGVKRIDGKREGIIDDQIMFNRIKEIINSEFPGDRKLIQKIDNAIDCADRMFTTLVKYTSSRRPWLSELKDYSAIKRTKTLDLSDLPDIPFELRVDVPSSEGESQPPEPQSHARPAPVAAPATRAPAAAPAAAPAVAAPTPTASAVSGDEATTFAEIAQRAIDLQLQGPEHYKEAIQLYLQVAKYLISQPSEEKKAKGEEYKRQAGILLGILEEQHRKRPGGNAGGGKRKRKYKRSKHKLKHSKLKKSHKRKKTLKRKYKKNKNKSKRR